MPVQKTRKRRGTRRSLMKKQRGGADDCNSIGKLRIPGYADCKYYYNPVVRATLSGIDPFYATEMQNRVLAAVVQYRAQKMKEAGATESTVNAHIRSHFTEGWPESVSEAVHDYLDYTEQSDADAQFALGYLMDTIRPLRKTRPSYAPLLSPSPSPSPAPQLSPVRSEEPNVRALSYSETVGDLQVPPASANTKEKLLAWIAAAKHADDHDPISLERWADMTKDELRRTVRTEEGRVYTTESLDGLVRAAIEAEAVPRDAYSRKPLTRKNLRALRNVMREATPTYELPSRIQQRPPKHMGFSVVESANGEFYELSLIDVRTGVELADLGVIPASITDEDSGSTDVTSAVAIATLQRAWDSGKFLTSYKRPFGCCQFHLGKTAEYWTSPGGSPVSRLAAMIAEIKSVLP